MQTKIQTFSADPVRAEDKKTFRKTQMTKTMVAMLMCFMSIISAFAQAVLPSDWVRPVKGSCLAINSGRQFGASRSNGRFHAAIDFVPSSNGNGTPVYACTGGYVIQNPYHFYGGTYALEVRNDDNTIIRYSEISTSFKAGMRVEKGQQIGKIIANSIGGSSMLHIEYYMGNASGGLTANNCSNYTYVTPKCYKRRSDLLDPTNFYSLSTYVAPPTKPIISWTSTTGAFYAFGDDLTVSWQPVSSAISYHLKIKQLSGEPNQSDNESGYLLKPPYNQQDWIYDWDSNGTFVSLPWSGHAELRHLTVGKYVKIYTQANLSNGTTSDYTYILVKPKQPTPTISIPSYVTPGQNLNIFWNGTNASEVRYECYLKELTDGLPDEGEDTSDEPGGMNAGAYEDKTTANNISSTNASFVLPTTLQAGRYLKIWIRAYAGYASTSWETRIPINKVSVSTNKNAYVKGETISVNGTAAGVGYEKTVFYLKDNTGENTVYKYKSPDLTSTSPQTTFSTSSLNPGTYYVYIVSYFNGIEVKDYKTITVIDAQTSSCKTPPDYDLSYTPDETWTSKDWGARINSSNDCKVYRIYGISGATYNLHIDPSSSFDAVLILYNNSGNQIGNTLDVSSNGGAEYHDYQFTYTGYIYAKVKGFSTSVGQFDFSCRKMPATATYTINVSANPSTGGIVSGSGTYTSGTSRSVTATTNSGYTFTNWTENGSVVSSSTTYTFNLTSNRTLVANFSQQTGTCLIIPNYDYSITPSTSWNTTSNSILSQGCKIYRFSATAGTKYSFKTGCGDGATATFDTKLYLYNSLGNELTNDDDGCESNRSKIEDWVCPSSGYYYLKVKGYDNYYGNYTLAYKKTDVAVTYAITVSANPSTGGTISGGGTYTSGSSCTVTATVNSGYTFTNWTENGSTVSSAATYQFTISGNRTLVANFTITGPCSNPIASGTCGSNLTWILCPNGTLTISGNGEMQDWGDTKDAPWYNENITSVIINSGVTKIGDRAFGWRHGLTSVTIPNTVTSIGTMVFDNCYDLSSVSIPTSVKSIGWYAFASTAITSINIPESVITIEEAAFSSCTSLTDITVNWTMPLSINSNVFQSIPVSNVNLHVPSGTQCAYAAAPVWQDFNIVGSQFTITASASNGGNISPSSTQTVICGSSKTFTFTPNTGYEINQVLVDGVVNSTAKTNGYYTFSNVTANHTISVTFNQMPALTVSPSSYNFTASSGTSSSISITSNQSWTISDNASWLTTSQTSGNNNSTFTITAQENTSTSSRNATVTVSGGGITRTISVTQDGRTLSTNANLSSLSVNGYSLSPSFNVNTVRYNVIVPNSVTTRTISATAEESHATISGTGSKSLNVGNNSFNIVVTAEAGNTKTYYLVITREQVANGIEDVEVAGINIFPNPAKDEISIQSDLVIKKIEILDLSGRNVATIVGARLIAPSTINVSKLPAGVYLLKIYTDKELITKRFVKE